MVGCAVLCWCGGVVWCVLCGVCFFCFRRCCGVVSACACGVVVRVV